MQQWEHAYLDCTTEEMLTDALTGYGEEGWELAAVTHQGGFTVDDPETGDATAWDRWQLFFKRPKP
jgi:hypothetical protein